MPRDQELRPILKDQNDEGNDAQETVLYDATAHTGSSSETPSSGDANSISDPKQGVAASMEKQSSSDDAAQDADSCCCCSWTGTHCKFGEQWKHFLLTAGSVVLAVVTVVTLPISLAGLDRVNSDAYALMYLGPFWSLILYILLPLPVILCSSHRDWIQYRMVSPGLVVAMGLCNLMSQMLQLYCGVPRRTPAHLQVVLSTILIPATILIRNQVFKEGLQRRQWACIIVVFIGVMVSMIPHFVVFSNDQMGPPINNNISVIEQEEEVQETLPMYARVLWPMGFVLGFIPQAVMIVLAEKHLKVDGGNPLVLCMFIQLITFAGALLLFWTDLIPGFGMAPTLGEFRVHQKRALQCMFAWGDKCNMLTSRVWGYFFTYGAGFLFQILIICYAEGAIYSVLVLSLVLPLGTIFWAMFGDNERYGRLVWEPQMETSTVFSFSGLLLLIPPVAFYDYYGIQERKQHQHEQLQ